MGVPRTVDLGDASHESGGGGEALNQEVSDTRVRTESGRRDRSAETTMNRDGNVGNAPSPRGLARRAGGVASGADGRETEGRRMKDPSTCLRTAAAPQHAQRAALGRLRAAGGSAHHARQCAAAAHRTASPRLFIDIRAAACGRTYTFPRCAGRRYSKWDDCSTCTVRCGWAAAPSAPGDRAGS